MKVSISNSLKASGESTARRLIRSRKEEMEYKMEIGVFEVVDEKECYDNGCKPLMLK